MQISFRSLHRPIIENIKKLFRQKLKCEKRKFCKIHGLSEVSKVHAACYIVNLAYKEISSVKGVKRN